MAESRIYRIGWGQRVFCIFFTAMSGFLLVWSWGGAIGGTREARLMEILVPIFLLIVGGLFTIRAFRSCIRLSETEISILTIFGPVTLPFEKIRGGRRYLDKGGYESSSVWRLKVEPNDDGFPTLDFDEDCYNLDDFFLAWFRALPDLDALKPETSNFGLV